MPRFLTKRLVLGYSLVTLILIVNAGLFLLSLRTGAIAGNWVTHTQDVMLHIRSVELLLADAESGQRGYLLTGDQRYLGSYEQALKRIDGEISTLRELTMEDPSEQQRVGELSALSKAKLSELAHTITLAKQGNMAAAHEIVASNLGHNLMEQIREILQAMTDEETQLLREREQTWNTARLRFVVTIVIATLVNALLLVLVGRSTYKRYMEHARHSEEIATEREWLKTVLTSIGDCVVATDATGKITFLNPVAEHTLKRTHEEVEGLALGEAFPISHEYSGEIMASPVERVIETGKTVLLANHAVVRCGDGSMVPIEDSAAPIKDKNGELRGVVMVFRDVSNAKKTEAALRQTEKLAAAGRLAASIAHEINNPLEAVANLLYLLGMEPLSDTARNHLTLAQSELERVAHMTKQTLGFYRDPSIPSSIDVAKVVSSVLNLYSGKLRTRSVKVVSEIEDGCVLFGPEGEFRQVISNLISNALDAMKSGGTLTIRGNIQNCDGEPVIVTSVEDTGTGIPADVLPHIFEPFYTTKQDVGTGLGLWVAHSLVEKNGGKLEVNTSVDDGRSGTRFEVTFPVQKESAAKNSGAS